MKNNETELAIYIKIKLLMENFFQNFFFSEKEMWKALGKHFNDSLRLASEFVDFPSYSFANW